MIRLILQISIFFYCSLAVAQTPVEITGVVRHAVNNQVLENVNVSIESMLGRGTVSDEEGRFIIMVESLPVTLIFSSISFDTRRVTISEMGLIDVRMDTSSTELPEIVVRAVRKVDTVFHEPINVIDYVFKGDYLILLAYKNFFDKYELILLDSYEEVIDRFPLKSEKPTSLFKSCVNNIYLQTFYGTYRLVLEEDKISLGGWVEAETFELVIQPCILEVDSLLFYQKYLYQGQVVQFYAFQNGRFESDSLTILPLIEDEDQIVRLIEQTGNKLPWSGDFWDDNISAGLKLIRDGPYAMKGRMRMFYPKLYIPIIRLEEKIAVFNHLEHAIQLYNLSGQKVEEVPIRYHQRKRWKKYILQDEITGAVYTAFHTRWGEYICEIDLETGALSPAIELDLSFIEKVSIRDGVLYFLHRNDYLGAQKKMIQKLRVN